MKMHILVTAIILGSFNLHAMEQRAQKRKKEFESMLKKEKKWGTWRAQAHALRNNPLAVAAAQTEMLRIQAAAKAEDDAAAHARATDSQRTHADGRRKSMRGMIPGPQATTAILTQNLPQTAHSTRISDDDNGDNTHMNGASNDGDDNPFVQFFAGKRDDIEEILDAYDKKERESRQRRPKPEQAITVVERTMYDGDNFDDFT